MGCLAALFALPSRGPPPASRAPPQGDRGSDFRNGHNHRDAVEHSRQIHKCSKDKAAGQPPHRQGRWQRRALRLSFVAGAEDSWVQSLTKHPLVTSLTGTQRMVTSPGRRSRARRPSFSTGISPNYPRADILDHLRLSRLPCYPSVRPMPASQEVSGNSGKTECKRDKAGNDDRRPADEGKDAHPIPTRCLHHHFVLCPMVSTPPSLSQTICLALGFGSPIIRFDKRLV